MTTGRPSPSDVSARRLLQEQPAAQKARRRDENNNRASETRALRHDASTPERREARRTCCVENNDRPCRDDIACGAANGRGGGVNEIGVRPEEPVVSKTTYGPIPTDLTLRPLRVLSASLVSIGRARSAGAGSVITTGGAR
jgi:hypothetical protein